MGIFIILLSASAISLTFLLALSHYQDEYCLNLTQLFKLDNSTGKSKLLRNLNFLQPPGKLWQIKIMVYSFSACIFAYPLAVTSLPLICEYEPEQIFVESLIAPIVPDGMLKNASKIGAALIYFFLSMYGASEILYILLLYIALGDVFTRVSWGLKTGSTAETFQRKDLSLVLKKYLGLYRSLEIITISTRGSTKNALGVLVTMGAYLAGAASYFVLFMYGKVPLAMYMACAIAVFFVFATLFVLTTLAALPNSNTEEFKASWKWAMVSKWGRLKLNSLGSVGFEIRYYETIVQKSTTLTLANMFVDTIVTVVLFA